jgi:hypothetical protein
MKPQGAKAKRTLADFLNRNNAAGLVEGQMELEDIELQTDRTKAELKPSAALAQDVSTGKTKPKSSPSRVRQSKPEPKPDITPAEKLRQRENQIHEASIAAKESSALPVQRAKAAELLSGILERPDFQVASQEWADGKGLCWEGAWLGAIAPLASAVVRKNRRPMLIVLAQHQDAETVGRDLDFFLDRNADVFPPSSDDIQEDLLQQQEVILRLQVLSRLDAARSHLLQKGERCELESGLTWRISNAGLHRAVTERPPACN